MAPYQLDMEQVVGLGKSLEESGSSLSLGHYKEVLVSFLQLPRVIGDCTLLVLLFQALLSALLAVGLMTILMLVIRNH